MAKSRRPAGPPRDILSANEDHHKITGFRLTTTSAVELVVTVCLYAMTLVFLLLAFQGFRYSTQRAEAHRAVATHMLEDAPDATESATGNYADDVALMLLRVQAALDAADFETAHDVSQRLLEVAPGDDDALLTRAVVLLADPATAGVETNRAEARNLLGEASDLPDAAAALGQLALDDGDIEGARAMFKRALDSGADVLASVRACAVAYNGLGVCQLAGDHDRLTSAEVREAIDNFRRAMGYGLPWAPPMINRDRAAAIWMRRAVAEADAAHGSNLPALREAMEKIETTFRTELGFAGLERNLVGTDLRSFSAYTRWPAQVPVKLTFASGVSEVEQGRAKAEPLIASRQRYLLNAYGLVRVRAIRADATSDSSEASLRANWTQLRDLFDDADVSTDGRFATRFNRVCAGLRVFRDATTLADRQMALGGGVAQLLRTFVENLDSVPEAQRTPLLTAMYVAMSNQPDLFVDGRVASGGEMLALHERWDLLDKINQSGGPRQPTQEWMQFQRRHLETLRELHRDAAGRQPGEQLRAILPWASRLAAALPVESAPDEAKGLVNPARTGQGPLLPAEIAGRYLDVGMFARLYEELLRKSVSAAMATAGSMRDDRDTRDELLRTAREAEICRARLCGYLIAVNGWCFGTSASVERLLDTARSNLQQIDERLGN